MLKSNAREAERRLLHTALGQVETLAPSAAPTRIPHSLGGGALFACRVVLVSPSSERGGRDKGEIQEAEMPLLLIFRHGQENLV